MQAAVAGDAAFLGMPEAKLRAQVMPFAKYKRDEAREIGSPQVRLVVWILSQRADCVEKQRNVAAGVMVCLAASCDCPVKP